LPPTPPLTVFDTYEPNEAYEPDGAYEPYEPCEPYEPYEPYEPEDTDARPPAADREAAAE
jgi:hypothetical protein